MMNIAVFVSGGGTNLQALIDAEHDGRIKNGRISLVIASNHDAYAIKRASLNSIKCMVISKKECLTTDEFDEKIICALEDNNIGLVVLAGYMSILSSRVTQHYQYKIMNVHPALIPSFCGEGYYGIRVHKAVLDYGVKLTGATVHFVNEVADGGAIILQRSVEVMQGDTPEILQKRVMEEAEWKILPQAVSLFCEDRIKIVDNKAVILG